MSLLMCYGNNSVRYFVYFIMQCGIISLKCSVIWFSDVPGFCSWLLEVYWYGFPLVGQLIAPSKPEVVKLSDTSVLVQWTILPPTGSHTITGFKLQFKELVDEGTALWRTVGEEISPSQRLHELARLKPGEQLYSRFWKLKLDGIFWRLLLHCFMKHINICLSSCTVRLMLKNHVYNGRIFIVIFYESVI